VSHPVSCPSDIGFMLWVSEVAEREVDNLPYVDFSLKISGALLQLPHTS